MPLARVGQTEEIEIIWRPFELRPEGQPPPSAEYIDRAWTQSVAPLAAQMGLEMRRPAHFSRTRLAHEAAAFARQYDKLGPMADALFRAYWQDGRDIAQIEVLCDVGLSVGLDPVGLRACLEGRTLRAQVDEELELAQRYRISAAPTFIIGDRFALRGLVAEEDLKRAIGMCRGEGLINLE